MFRPNSFSYLGFVLLLSACAGMKVVNPNDKNKNAGTKMLDLNTGKIVDTFDCKIESPGKNYSATGSTEQEARDEVLARCRSGTLISFCESDKVRCVQN